MFGKKSMMTETKDSFFNCDECGALTFESEGHAVEDERFYIETQDEPFHVTSKKLCQTCVIHDESKCVCCSDKIKSLQTQLKLRDERIKQLEISRQKLAEGYDDLMFRYEALIRENIGLRKIF